ncbi:MAG: class I SAM-dependent methyltransferase [Rhodospirillaceae bacterium]|nr:class I SAM-dependent methyltransferase [Rhodospirillaceae bacterium]
MTTEEKQLEEIASQLACPSGDGGSAMGEKMNDTNAFITERSIETLAPQAGERIVEIGPGNGVLSLPVVKALGDNGHYMGLELSEDMARQAQETLTRCGASRISIHTGDCRAAPIDERSIDGLIAINVLYFIDDISVFFAMVLRWLKPGGRAVFGVRSDQSLKGMPFTRYGFHIVRRHINWNTQGPDLKEGLAHLVQDIKRRVCGIASAGIPSFSV